MDRRVCECATDSRVCILPATLFPVPQSEPERLRGELEALLSGAGVQYSYSTTTKYGNFRNKTLI